MRRKKPRGLRPTARRVATPSGRLAMRRSGRQELAQMVPIPGTRGKGSQASALRARRAQDGRTSSRFAARMARMPVCRRRVQPVASNTPARPEATEACVRPRRRPLVELEENSTSVPSLAAMRRPSGETRRDGHVRSAGELREGRCHPGGSSRSPSCPPRSDWKAMRLPSGKKDGRRSRAASSVRRADASCPSACATKMSSRTDPCESNVNERAVGRGVGVGRRGPEVLEDLDGRPAPRRSRGRSRVARARLPAPRRQ